MSKLVTKSGARCHWCCRRGTEPGGVEKDGSFGIVSDNGGEVDESGKLEKLFSLTRGGIGKMKGKNVILCPL